MPRLNPPPHVLDIACKLEAGGFQAWCVGGAVRDALLGHVHLDWDLATSATPDQVRRLFGGRRTIPVGVEFGTVGVLDPDGVLHEVTTFRRDVKTDGRHAVVEFGASLDEDLARRDFTINAIAYSPSTEEIRDPFGGRADLERRVVRAVGDPEARMREDRLRALRAIRFASRFGFTIESATLRAIEASAPHLGRLSPERVKQELEKTMEQVRCPSAALRLWKSTGALATLVPSIRSVPEDFLAALDHMAMPGLPGRPQRRVNRMAVLFLEVPEAEVLPALAALRCSRHESNWVAMIAERWRALDAEMSASLAGGVPDAATIRRWVSAIGRLNSGAVMRVSSAVWSARRAAGRPAPVASAVRSLYRRMLRSAWKDPLEVRDLAVDGDDLKTAGIPAGPALGRILHSLLGAVLADPSRNVRDWLLHEAKRLQAEGS